MNLSQSQQDTLIRSASQKLGVTEAQLRSELQKGTFDRLLATLPQNQAQMLTKALSNPSTASAILSSPQAKELMKKLFG